MHRREVPGGTRHEVLVRHTALEAVGLPQQQYAGHNFRAATTAALVGIEDSGLHGASG